MINCRSDSEGEALKAIGIGDIMILQSCETRVTSMLYISVWISAMQGFCDSHWGTEGIKESEGDCPW